MQAGHPLRGEPVCTAPLYLVQQTPREHGRASSVRAVRDCLTYIWNEKQKRALIILGEGNGLCVTLNRCYLWGENGAGHLNVNACRMWVCFYLIH